MGIPLLVGRVLLVHFNQIFKLTLPDFINWLTLDLNAIFHSISGKVYVQGAFLSKLEKAKKFAEIERLNAIVASKSDAQLEEELFQEIGNYIIDTVAQVNPIKGLILAVDGLAPLSKINQQKSRRIKAAFDRQSSTKPGVLRFNNSSVFTPCTELMFRLDQYLRRFISAKQSQLPPRVVYSSHLVPAEGEHKIIKYIRDNIPSNQSVVIWGMDGDLIMLGLRLPHAIFIVRGDLEQDYRYNHQTKRRELDRKVIDIPELRQRLTTAKVGINEFIFACFLYGNDFLPHQPGLDSITNSFPIIWDLLKNRSFFQADSLDIPAWLQFLSELAPYQSQLIAQVAQESLTYPFAMAQAALTPQNSLDQDKFSQLWYNRLFFQPPVTYTPVELQSAITNLTSEYLTTMLWVWQYYYDHKSVNWNWAYSRLFAPLLKDAATTTGVLSITPQPYLLNPIGQLFTVIPKLNRSLVPAEAQAVYEDNSPISDMYPSTVITLVEGHAEQQAYLGVPLMPSIDLPRVIAVQNRLDISKKTLERYAEATVVIMDRAVGFRPQAKTIVSLPVLPKPNAAPVIKKVDYSGSGFESDQNLKTLSSLYGYDVVREMYPPTRRFYPEVVQLTRALYDFVVVPIVVRQADGTPIGIDQGQGLITIEQMRQAAGTETTGVTLAEVSQGEDDITAGAGHKPVEYNQIDALAADALAALTIEDEVPIRE